MLKFLDRESVDLFHGDTYKASEVARVLLAINHFFRFKTLARRTTFAAPARLPNAALKAKVLQT